MMPFVPFTILNLAVFRLSEKFPRTDRQTDKPSYRSSSPELKNDPKCMSKSKVKIEGNIENKKCSAI